MFVFYYISVLAYKYDLSLYIILIKNEKKVETEINYNTQYMSSVLLYYYQINLAKS